MNEIVKENGTSPRAENILTRCGVPVDQLSHAELVKACRELYQMVEDERAWHDTSTGIWSALVEAGVKGRC
jgi:hypothetical protein